MITGVETEYGLQPHELKIDPIIYGMVESGSKKFEIRKNDRNFKIGDCLLLKETKFSCEEMAGGKPLLYTGEQLTVFVTNIMRGPVHGLKKGWVIMSIDL